MRKLILVGSVVGVATFAVPASASVFDLSFSGAGITGDLVLSLATGASPYTVDGVTGSVTVGTTSYTVSGITAYAGDDQKVHYPATSTTSYVDFPGVSVETSGGFALNLFALNASRYGVLLSDQNASGNPSPVPTTPSRLPIAQ